MGFALPGQVTAVVTPPARAILKPSSLGLDGVHGPHLGYNGIGGLVGVVALKPEDLFFDAKGAVRLDDTGSHIVPAGRR